MSPTQIKPKLLALIEQEAKKGEEGAIIAKMNSLVDQDIIVGLYKASMTGVKINLIVRGICCLRPRVAGISENIRVISIVGKYLEHARIFYFKHSVPQIFISSADWMPRNLERRVELMIPVFDKELSEKLFEILNLQINDTLLARELQENGEYKSLADSKQKINSQLIMEEYTNMIYFANKKENISRAKKLARRLLKES